MLSLNERIKNMTREIKHYGETRLELMILNMSEKAAYLIGQSVQQLAGYAILGIGLVFGLTALAIYLGELLGQRWAGYAIVAVPFIILGLYFVISKPKSMTARIQAQIMEELSESYPANKKEIEQLSSKETSTKEEEKRHNV